MKYVLRLLFPMNSSKNNVKSWSTIFLRNSHTEQTSFAFIHITCKVNDNNIVLIFYKLSNKYLYQLSSTTLWALDHPSPTRRGKVSLRPTSKVNKYVFIVLHTRVILILMQYSLHHKTFCKVHDTYHVHDWRFFYFQSESCYRHTEAPGEWRTARSPKKMRPSKSG